MATVVTKLAFKQPNLQVTNMLDFNTTNIALLVIALDLKDREAILNATLHAKRIKDTCAVELGETVFSMLKESRKMSNNILIWEQLTKDASKIQEREIYQSF